MDLRQKVGQLFMLGSDREDPSGFVEQLAQLRAGGAILFNRDIDEAQQLRALNDSINERVELACGIRPFIAVDQEGGRVARLRGDLCPELPSNEKQGERFLSGEGASVIEEVAVTAARALLDLHFNMNLAPVADVLTAADSEVLASRCYGSSPEFVADLASIYAAKLQSLGVIATAKHFPGHGGTVVDSHIELPEMDISIQELEATHLPPFRRLANEGIAAVMPAHIRYTSLDEKPAPQSRRIIHELLIQEMQHSGVIITDDLMMGAVMNHGSLAETCIEALQAGVSLLLICSHPEEQSGAYDAVLSAFSNGTLSSELLEGAIRRNFSIKKRFGIM